MSVSQPAEWAIETFEDAQGRRPVSEWIRGLDAKDRARIRRALDLLQAYGAQLRMPYARHLRGKLFELRVASGRRAYRVLYFAATGRRFILLHGFVKATAKTPERELEIAERRMAEYLEGLEENER